MISLKGSTLKEVSQVPQKKFNLGFLTAPLVVMWGVFGIQGCQGELSTPAAAVDNGTAAQCNQILVNGIFNEQETQIGVETRNYVNEEYCSLLNDYNFSSSYKFTEKCEEIEEDFSTKGKFTYVFSTGGNLKGKKSRKTCEKDNFGKTTLQNFYENICTNMTQESTLKDRTRTYIKEASEAIVLAWTECVAQTSEFGIAGKQVDNLLTVSLAYHQGGGAPVQKLNFSLHNAKPKGPLPEELVGISSIVTHFELIDKHQPASIAVNAESGGGTKKVGVYDFEGVPRKITKTLANGSIFDGLVDYLDRFQGPGRMEYKNGDVYDGNWKDGKRQGNGFIEYASGGDYDGEWLNGKRHGEGVETTADDRYDGSWARGKRHGVGILTQGGVEVESQWSNGQRLDVFPTEFSMIEGTNPVSKEWKGLCRYQAESEKYLCESKKISTGESLSYSANLTILNGKNFRFERHDASNNHECTYTGTFNKGTIEGTYECGEPIVVRDLSFHGEYKY